ncbi:E3 ubiquitin-protein ligase pub1 [Malassezia cuniculi]|uniref:E3 ubiquitin-protein ligase pub1 n=1 Tax=Malassezia cuniculi TaxID=948313 RepID=A0AAF0J732_9BASI|nr:E3 ubiquitin-protein ligase pub1 [Malassezia cuniculi]
MGGGPPKDQVGGQEPTADQVSGRRPYLYVGNLSVISTERTLVDLFRKAGVVRSVKLVEPGTSTSSCYGFVEYTRLADAERALQMFSGYKLYGREMCLNWAHQGALAGEPAQPPPLVPQGLGALGLTDPDGPAFPAGGADADDDPLAALVGGMNLDQPRNNILPPTGLLDAPEAHRKDTRQKQNMLYCVFVGDLAPEIDDAALAQAFDAFPSMHDARIMWDLRSHHSRGYGFVRFFDEKEAATSIQTLNGQWLGSRIIRVNWASRRKEPAPTTPSESDPASRVRRGQPLSYATALQMAPREVCTVYVGNLPRATVLQDIVPAFVQFGRIIHAHVHEDRHYAFVTFDTHESAAMAIASFSRVPLMVQGRIARTGWGRFSHLAPSTLGANEE